MPDIRPNPNKYVIGRQAGYLAPGLNHAGYLFFAKPDKRYPAEARYPAEEKILIEIVFTKNSIIVFDKDTG